MARPIVQSRSVKVDITIHEKTDQNAYGDTTVATHTIKVDLPARSVDIGAAVVDALNLMRGNVDRFRGSLDDIEATAVIQSE